VPCYVVFCGDEDVDFRWVHESPDVVIFLVFCWGWPSSKVLEAYADCVGWLRLLEWIAPGLKVTVVGLVGVGIVGCSRVWGWCRRVICWIRCEGDILAVVVKVSNWGGVAAGCYVLGPVRLCLSVMCVGCVMPVMVWLGYPGCLVVLWLMWCGVWCCWLGMPGESPLSPAVGIPVCGAHYSSPTSSSMELLAATWVCKSSSSYAWCSSIWSWW